MKLLDIFGSALMLVGLLGIVDSMCRAQDKKPGPVVMYENGGLVATTYFQPQIMIGGTDIIVVNDPKGKLMVRIDRANKATYGEGYTPDEGARHFWDVLTKYYPQVCNDVTKPKP